HQLLHLVELRGRGLDVVIAEHHAPNRGSANIIGDVDADALLLQARKILAEGLPARLNAEKLKLFFARTANEVVHGRDGFAFAGNLGGDALIDFRRQARVDENRQLGLAKHVDKAGSDHLAASVKGAPTGSGGEVADGRDFSASNANVTREPGGACAIDDSAMGNDDVEGRGLRERLERRN